MSKHAENALQHSLGKCERRLEAAELRLAAYENLRAAIQNYLAYPTLAGRRAILTDALAALDRLDREKP